MSTWTFNPDQYGEYIDHGESFDFKLREDPGMELSDEVILTDEEGNEIAKGEVEGQQKDEGPQATRWAATIAAIRPLDI